MTQAARTLTWSDPEATAAAGHALAQTLAPGDTVLLDGPVGAGKTHFARALIQSILAVPEDVPSPTFTLVQTYETARGPLWHTDLYRLTSPAEVDELGLFEAFSNAICLVEWPDRLGSTAPREALTLTLETAEKARRARLHWQDAKWADKIAAMAGHD